MNKKYNRLLEYNDKNEIVGSYLREVNSEVIYIKKELSEKQRKFLNNKSELHKYSEKLGGYINMCYVRNKLLFNELNIDKANISRLIYLATYIDYNNRQENLLIKHGKNYKIEPMARADIKKVLGLGDTVFKSFMSDMRNNNLLFEANNKFYISNDYFSKGKCNFNNKEYTRIYINTTRMLFENCTSRQHKQLSYIYQLIPFMNYELNIICKNPSETDFYKLEKLSLLQICELLGVSTDKDNMRKFRNDLLKFYVKMEEKKYYFLSYARILNGHGLKDYFVVNPQITWGGKDMRQIKETIQVCFFE
ncbi:hypothetical protein LZ906_017835 (plasmid) [Paraclostridium ghonii]|uniref:hypothetical protein n=1 Tax=Paraclostridium ghonii TaxID=29358 RepID=UPI00202CB89B|nr:hypothetical protein [Paeniclostridium ghonii]MCM0167417.1 hypothetical protein [Paeniclostridium ghonii]